MSAPVIQSTAEISRDGVYRYRLTRRWETDDRASMLRWIMLNPSTADASLDDPTIRRCMGFARAWGYGGIVVHNLYALRATDPRQLRDHPDPVGPVNDSYIAGWRVPTICAWGAHADSGRPGRAAEMIALRSGLGYLIIDSRNAGNRYDLVIAGMIIIGLIGLMLDGFMRMLESMKVVRWRYAH